MFIEFFYKLRDAGIPATPTSFLLLHRALDQGLALSLSDFYVAARSILVKSERHLDIFDQMFAHHFEGAELPDDEGFEIDEMARALLEQWLTDPKTVAEALGADEEKLARLSPEELIEYFKQRLEEQTERHDDGNRWIGTGGTSPVGHSGYHPGGMRIGGESRNRSAVKVANERRYKDYSRIGPLTPSSMTEALKRLRNLVPDGPRDKVNVEESIYQTMKNAGEIEIVFERGLRDRLKLLLLIDNGGYSMDPHIPVVQTLFNYARSQFKDLKVYFFHNTIYGTVWEDPSRYKSPVSLFDVSKMEPDTRLIIVGDASMAPYELVSPGGSIYVGGGPEEASIERLRSLARTFPYNAWLNPLPPHSWAYTRTIGMIRRIFPMYELSVDGLESAVGRLMAA